MKDEKILNEAKELFEFCSPKELRGAINLLFTNYISSNKECLQEDVDEISSRVYFLVKFLESVE